MKDYIVDLTDGTRLSVNVNFGTLYYLQKMPKFYKLAKKKKESLTDTEKMDLAAASVYATLRSNGKTVTFDEALQLVPMDDEQIRVLLEGFSARCDEYAKKKRARQQMAKGLT